jgi:hypothetical protein
LTGCATNKAQRSLAEAYADKARADAAQVAMRAADKAIEDARRMPDLPAECRRTWRSGTQLDEDAGASNLKYDQALGDANKQITWCAGWYDRTQAGREPK